MFNLGGNLQLQSATAQASFNNGLTTLPGGILNLGLGEVSASSVHLTGGSVIQTLYDGTDLGQLTSTGSLTIDSGIRWTIFAGTNTVSVGTEFDVATAAGTLTTNMSRASSLMELPEMPAG
jgi:hypothetical protein